MPSISARAEFLASILGNETSRQITDRLDIPDCGCDLQLTPVCVLCRRPCQDRIESGKCPCILDGVPRCLHLGESGCTRLVFSGHCNCPLIPKCIHLGKPCRWRIASGHCECPEAPAVKCPHILARKHDVSAEEWEELLRELNPREYLDPSPPRTAAVFLDRNHRVAVMALRHASGRGLHHPGDLESDDCDEIGVEVERAPNGRPMVRQLVLRGELEKIAAIALKRKNDAKELGALAERAA